MTNLRRRYKKKISRFAGSWMMIPYEVTLVTAAFKIIFADKYFYLLGIIASIIILYRLAQSLKP